MKRFSRIPFVLLCLCASAVFSLRADTYYLKAGDGQKKTSFTTVANWTNEQGNAASVMSGHDFVVNNNLAIRTPQDSNAFSFAGDSLTIHTDLVAGSGNFSKMMMKHFGGESKPMTVDRFILENGYVTIATGYKDSGYLMTILGGLWINEGYYGFLGAATDTAGDQRKMKLKSTLHGSGTLVFAFGSTKESGTDIEVYLQGDASDFTGRVWLGRDDTYMPTDAPGEFYVNVGTTWFGNPAAFDPAGLTVRNGSTVIFRTDVANTANRGVTIADAKPTFQFENGATVTMAAPIASDCGFVKKDSGSLPGTLVLSADNSGLTAEAEVTISGGTVAALNAKAFGSASVSFAEGTTLALDAATGPVAFASLPTGLVNLSLTGDSLSADTTKIDLFSFPAGESIDLEAISVASSLPEGIDASKMVLQATEADERVTVSYMIPAKDTPTVEVALGAVTETSATFSLKLGYYDENITTPLGVTAYYGSTDCGMTAADWDHCLSFDPVAPGTHEFTVPLQSGNLYSIAFSVQSGTGEPVWTASETVNTTPVTITLSETSLFENDPNGVVLTVSRPAEASALPLTVTLSYEGGGMESSLQTEFVFAEGVSELKKTLFPADNAEADGNRVLTIAAVESDEYLVDACSTAQLTVLDDESAVPAECIWTGAAGDGKWGTPENWSDGKIPTFVDAAVFRSLATDQSVTVSGVAKMKRLIIETDKALTFTAANDGAALLLEELVRRDLPENEEANIAFDVRLQLAAGPDGRFVCAVSGSGEVVTSSNIVLSVSAETAETSIPFHKIGDGTFVLNTPSLVYAGPWTILAGKIRADQKGSIPGDATIGGGETQAVLEGGAEHMSGPENSNATYSVMTNGVYRNLHKNQNSRVKAIHAFGNAVVEADQMHNTWQFKLDGATISSGRFMSGGSGQILKSVASPVMSVFSGAIGLHNKYGATIEAADGGAIVDLLCTEVFKDGTTDKTLTKKGDGILKTTADWTGFNPKCSVLAGTWYVDNTGSYGLGKRATFVSPGGKLGGTGHIGRHDTNFPTLTLNAGTAEKFATLAPGTIDNETGEHVYGTFTVAYPDNTNVVSFADYAHLEIGLGPRGAAGNRQADKLKVHGALNIGANCVLDLTANSCDPKRVANGVYTLVEADAINGSFASVVLPEGCKNWKISTVSAVAPGDGPNGEDVSVVRITAEVHSGFKVLVR